MALNKRQSHLLRDLTMLTAEDVHEFAWKRIANEKRIARLMAIMLSVRFPKGVESLEEHVADFMSFGNIKDAKPIVAKMCELGLVKKTGKKRYRITLTGELATVRRIYVKRRKEQALKKRVEELTARLVAQAADMSGAQNTIKELTEERDALKRQVYRLDEGYSNLYDEMEGLTNKNDRLAARFGETLADLLLKACDYEPEVVLAAISELRRRNR